MDNLSWLPTVTYEQFLEFKPCWLDDEEKAAQLKEIGSRKREWNALDVLQLEEVDIEDRMWAVLREEFLPANLLHEYACRCADYALSKIDNPDPRSIRAVEAKRQWMRGEISDEELDAARIAAEAAARDAKCGTTRNAAWSAVRSAARDAVWAAERATARAAEQDAVWGAARDAVWAAVWAAERATARAAEQDAVWGAARDAVWAAVWAAAWEDLLNILINLVREAG